jgi:threonine/homoserine/homoserine lactone efflux protein
VSLEVVAAFIAACWLLAWTPGPMMALILANVSSHGLRGGFYTLAGNLFGLSLLVAAAALGMTSVMVFMSEWFDVVRWIGALYLAWLGYQKLRQFWSGPPALPQVAAARGRSLFLQALMVALSNPKVLLFLGAFLPQFVDARGDVGLQLTVLAVLFVAVVGTADTLYTLAVGRMRGLIASGRLRVLDGVSGVLLLLGGLALATARRP